jgi:hypothetical protein
VSAGTVLAQAQTVATRSLPERAAPVALFLLALIVRWPEHAAIPAPTDETDELLWALAILQDGARPLTASDPYIGPLMGYLTAAAFWLVGQSWTVGRLVAVVMGATVAPATWLFARALGGPTAGLVAGLLMAVAFGPTVVGSHIAWSHGGTATFTALALAGLVRLTGSGTRVRDQGLQPSRPGSRRGCSAGLLALATGVAAGLALGLHPTVAALAPGVLIWWWFTASRRDRFPVGTVMSESRTPRGAEPWRRYLPPGAGWLCLGAVTAYGPVLAQLAVDGPQVLRASAADREYVGTTFSGWLLGVGTWLESLLRNLAGPVASGIWSPDGPNTQPTADSWLGAALVVAALLVACVLRARAGRTAAHRTVAGRINPVTSLSMFGLPLAVVSSGALLMPAIMTPDRFGSLTGLRYSAAALPAVAAAIGLLLGPLIASTADVRARALASVCLAVVVAVRWRSPLVSINLPAPEG